LIDLPGHGASDKPNVSYTQERFARAVDAFVSIVPNDPSEREKPRARLDGFAKSFRAPDYKEASQKMIESMFSDKTTPVQREEIRSKMLATPHNVCALPTLAVIASNPGRVGYEDRLRAIFPSLNYGEWQGSGHFLMMESPDRFNRALDNFLAHLLLKQSRN